MVPPRLPGLVAVAVVIVAAVLRLAVASPGGPDLPNRLVPALLATAALCVAGLTLRRGPALAWFAIVLAALIGAVEIVAVVRAWDPVPTDGEWLTLSVLAGSATVGAVFVAAGYATVERANRFGAGVARGLAWIGLGIVVAGELWAIASAASGVAAGAAVVEPDVIPIRVATRIMLGTVVALGLFGAARDLVPPARRAWAAGPAGGRSFPRRLIEELVPAWAASRRAAAQRERATLAAELHARVLPELRSALAAAAAAEGESRLSERLRGTLDDIETLMAERHSVVLEEFGLLAALEWLAERMQARSASEITVDVVDAEAPPATNPARPPRDVERAAFRVALLAVDNATRHVPGATVKIEAAIAPRSVAVEIVDDGPGLGPFQSADAARAGRRGLLDMRTEAAAIGASLVIGGGTDDSARNPGTRVTFRWPSR